MVHLPGLEPRTTGPKPVVISISPQVRFVFDMIRAKRRKRNAFLLEWQDEDFSGAHTR